MLNSTNLLDVFEYYLSLVFVISTAIRAGLYWAMVRLIYVFRGRWPKLFQLVTQHWTIFLGWQTLFAVASALALMVAHTLASRLLWVQAKVTFEDLGRHWYSLLAIVPSGVLMLAWDFKAVFRIGHFNRLALYADLDKAEYWLKSWAAPAVRMFTFGFVNPKKIAGAEVYKAIVKANQRVIGGMWDASRRTGVRLAFGLSLWLTWALAIRG
jgi:hypothetical protein